MRVRPASLEELLTLKSLGNDDEEDDDENAQSIVFALPRRRGLLPAKTATATTSDGASRDDGSVCKKSRARARSSTTKRDA
jgi:hypothetical protein